MNLTTTWAIIVTAIPALLAFISGVFKLTGAKAVIDALNQVGYLNYARILGIAEIIFAALFVFPATNLIGFVLLACYFSGALAVDISHRRKINAPLMILILLFVAEFIAYGHKFFS